MKRKLLKQIIKEWRSNVWILTELTLVGAFVFGLVYTLSDILHIYNLPSNFDLNNTYLINFSELPETAPGFDHEAANRPLPTKRYEFFKTLRNHPIVEAATISFASNPYCSNSQGITCRADTTSTDFYNAGLYQVSPDFTVVYRLEGVNGETPEQLATMLKEDKVLISQDMFPDAENLVNKRIYDSQGQSYLVGAVIKPVRRNDYYTRATGFFMRMPDIMYGNWLQAAVRIKPDFKGDVTRTLVKEVRKGNTYVQDVIPMTDLRKKANRTSDTKVRNLIIIVFFVLFNLFLGVLGTFWLRTQARANEIAIRKVNGATNSSVLRRILSEGIIMLTVAMIVGVPIGYISLKLINGESPEMSIACFAAAVTYMVTAIMVVLGTVFPTMKAVRINPVEALKSE